MNVTSIPFFLLLGATVAPSLVAKVHAQPVPAAQSCEAVLYDLANELRFRDAKLAAFAPKDDGFLIGLEGTSIPDTVIVTAAQGKSALALMNSPKLGFSYAQRVLGACPQYKRFSIALWRTGWRNEWLRFPDGSVRPYICIGSFREGANAREDGVRETPYGVGYCD